MTVEKFISEYGRKRFVEDTGYIEQVVSRAISENIMPSGWFIPVRDCCKKRGVEVPEHLFRVLDKRPKKETDAAA